MKFEKLTELIHERITGEWGQEPVSSSVKVIRTTNFTNEGKLDLWNVVERDIEVKKIEKKSLQKGDIIIEKSGGGPTQPVGRVVYFDIDSDEKYLCNNFTTILRPKLNLVDSKYLLYQMLYLHKSGRTKRYQNKTTGIHNLNLEKYLQEKIALPPLPDQLHIANILSKAENLIAQRKESIRLLDEFLKSTFLEMFGDPVRNEKGWNIGKFKDLANLDRKQVLPSEFTNEDFYIGLEDIEKETGNIIKTSSENAEDLKSSKFRFTPNHILYAKLRPYLNKVALPNQSGICSTDIFPVLPLEGKANRYFICYLMRSKTFVTEMHSKSSGANLPRASASVIENFKTYQPPIELQTQFAQIVEKTEALKSQYQQSLQELENLYGSLSQKAFKGELLSEL
jgi:type I restriction enzyme S subunit